MIECKPESESAMHTATLRSLGGSVSLTLPKQLLKALSLQSGSEVQIALERDKLIVSARKRPKYTLEQLLAQCEGKKFRIDREWDRAAPVGKEVI